jgi:DNA-binding transcriptional ArsR family regulator
MSESALTHIFGDSSRMKILEYFLEFPANEFTPSELVRDIGMSRSTVFRELDSLIGDEMLIQTRKQGKSPVFKINPANPIVRLIQQGIYLKSDLIADKQLASKRIRTIVRKTLNNHEVLLFRKKQLKEELSYTTKKLKEMPAQ